MTNSGRRWRHRLRSGSTVLLVEDNPSDARLIEESLSARSRPDPDVTAPAIERVDRIADAASSEFDQVDTILLDLGLPDSTGLDTLDEMIAVCGGTPVVVLTGLDDERVGVEAVEHGAQDYLVKDDLTPRLLRQTLRYAIERERRQQELQQRNTELALLNQVVRHDIRNDVSVILSWGDALERHVDEDGSEYLDRMLAAGEHITNITETVGDFLGVLEGDSNPELRPIDLEGVLIHEVEKARSAHDGASITLTGNDGRLQVAATELLSSVFRNLLNNAVVHNDKPDPEITVAIEEQNETVVVDVVDRGPGVPDDQKDEVFGRGEMGLESSGSGIGLYLVDTLVEMYDGDVALTDNEPEGSVFRIQLQKYWS